jgi:PAS domain S-box-containing protein
MLQTLKPRLRAKIALLLFLPLFGLLCVGASSFFIARDILIDARGQKLQAVASGQESNVRHVVTAWHDRMNLISSRTSLRKLFKEQLENPSPENTDQMRAILRDAIAGTRAIEAVTLCGLDGANIVSINQHGHKQAKTCVEDPTQATRDIPIPVQKVWRETNGIVYALITGPIILGNEQLGTIQLILNAQEILDVTQNYDGLGETGETTLAERTPDGDAHFVTPLRHDDNLDLTLIVPKEKVEVPITDALAGRELILRGDHTVDYRGAPVIAATAYIPEMDWGLVVKYDRKEALAPVALLLELLLAITLLIFVLVALLGYRLSRSITVPLMALTRAVRTVQKGKTPEKVAVLSNDELGELATAFNELYTLQENQENALLQSRERLRAIFDTSVDGLVTIDEVGNIESFNKSCEEIFGYTEEEVLGKNVKILMPEPYHSEHDSYLSNYIETGHKKIIGIGREVKGKRKNGEIFPIDLSVAEVKVPGQKRLFSGIIRDITERKKAEEDLKTSEERFQIAVEGSSTGVWDWDISTDKLYWSPRLKEIFGVTDANFTPHFNEFESRLHPEDRDKVIKALEDHMLHKKPYNMEYRVRHGEGDYIWILARGQAIWDETTGDAIRMAGSVDDVTDKKNAERSLHKYSQLLAQRNQELERSNQDLEDFAYIAAHDLREPLRGLFNYASFLNEDYADKLGPDGKRQLESLMKLSQRLNDLVGSLLYYSRVGRQDMALQQTDITSVVQDIIEELDIYLNENNATVTIKGKLPPANCDSTRIGEVFRNLITNAVKYNDAENKEITISATVEDGIATYSVADNGIGIPEKHLETIFKMFKRLHKREDYGGGTGSGLTIIKKIVEQHNGRIWAENLPENAGAKFNFILNNTGANEE